MRFDTPVLLVGNGPVEAAALALALPFCAAVVGADGGADRALAHGLNLAATIGDMDSAKDRGAESRYGQIIKISDQNTTDFQKCLAEVNAPLIIGIGFLGGRLDHELAALNALAKTTQPVVLIGAEDIVFLLPPHFDITLPVGTRISFFPMASGARIKTVGLEWPLDGVEMSPSGAISASNRTAAPLVKVGSSGQPVLCILPRAHLAATLIHFKS